MAISDNIQQFIGDSLKTQFEQLRESLSALIRQQAEALGSSIAQQRDLTERDISSVIRRVYVLEQSVEKMNLRMGEILDTLEQLSNSFGEKEEAVPVQCTSGIEEKQIDYEPVVLYAHMPDSSEPLGFILANLKNNADDAIFSITLTDDCHGKFSFVENADTRQSVLAAFNPIVTESSVYDYVPQNPVRIDVLEDGEVIKENGVLVIIKKQKIKIE